MSRFAGRQGYFYARVVLTQQLKRLMLDDLGCGLALEGLGAMDLANVKG